MRTAAMPWTDDASPVADPAAFEALAAPHRPRLVRLCARLAGDPQLADDLAQETLLEAWRHRDRLHDRTGAWPWLAAIAANVCRRQRRRTGWDAAHRLLTRPGDPDPAADVPAAWDAVEEFEVELERGELAALLDRALALLPEPSRHVLVERYVRESPQAEVAGRLGLSEGAVAMRLHRGKLQLRRLLAGDLRDHAAAHALLPPAVDAWEETRIWCHRCGRHRLRGRFDRPGGAYALRCPACCAAPDALLVQTRLAALLRGVSGHKAVLNRFMAWSHDHFARAVAVGAAPCRRCGTAIPLRHGRLPAPTPAIARGQFGLWLTCPACGEGEGDQITLASLALDTPAGRAFWRDHPRLRTLPVAEVEADGRPLLLVRHESVAGTARLDARFDRETYRLLDIHVAG